jgi:hypothetical protein
LRRAQEELHDIVPRSALGYRSPIECESKSRPAAVPT